MTHPVDLPAVREEIKDKAALLKGGPGKVIVEFDHVGPKVTYNVSIKFPRKTV